MKKILSMAIIFVSVFVCSACGTKNDIKNNTQESQEKKSKVLDLGKNHKMKHAGGFNNLWNWCCGFKGNSTRWNRIFRFYLPYGKRGIGRRGVV